MRLATSSNIVCERPNGEVFTLEKTLQLASKAGFDRFDISFYVYKIIVPKCQNLLARFWHFLKIH